MMPAAAHSGRHASRHGCLTAAQGRPLPLPHRLTRTAVRTVPAETRVPAASGDHGRTLAVKCDACTAVSVRDTKAPKDSLHILRHVVSVHCCHRRQQSTYGRQSSIELEMPSLMNVP